MPSWCTTSARSVGWPGREVGPDDVEPGTWAQYEAGLTASAGDYLEALGIAHAWARRLMSWWSGGGGFDLLLTPTLAEPPPEIGFVRGTREEPWLALARALPFAVFTAPFNMSGQPAMSVPLRWSDNGLPIGVQLVAAQYREDVLLRVASQLEAVRPWADRRPPLHA